MAGGGRLGKLDVVRRWEERIYDLVTDSPDTWRRLGPPAGILLIALICLYWLPPLDPAWSKILEISPYMAAVIGMLLAVHFHRGRPLFLLLNGASFYWCYRTFLAAGIEGVEQEKIFHAVTCLVPLNAFLFTLLKERGALTEAGKFRLVGLGGEALAAYFLFHYNYATLAPLFTGNLRVLSLFTFLGVSHFACVLFLLAAVGVTVLALQRKKAMETWVLGFIAASFMACNWIATPHAATIFTLAACGMVIAAILQESYQMAFRDDLTGILSRRALNDAIYGLGSEYAIAMVDVDHFKNFNDTYGHNVGDQVLKLVAKKLTGVGGNGKAYRYGGEEFTIIFPGLSAEETAPHVERLRQEIADYSMILRGNDRPKDDRKGKKQVTGSRSGPSFNVTVSIGVAQFGRDLPTPEEVIIAADKALYRAKQQGRNQVAVA